MKPFLTTVGTHLDKIYQVRQTQYIGKHIQRTESLSVSSHELVPEVSKSGYANLLVAQHCKKSACTSRVNSAV